MLMASENQRRFIPRNILIGLIIFFLIGLFPTQLVAQSTLEYMALQSQVHGAAQQGAGAVAQSQQHPQPRQQDNRTDLMQMLKDFFTAIQTKVPPLQLGIIFLLLAIAWFLMRS